MRLPSHHDSGQPEISMTPMIDIVFQLLIFFICTASFQMTEDVLPTTLAEIGGKDSAAPAESELDLQPIVVRATQVEGETHWMIEDRQYESLADVRRALGAIAENDRSLPVVLDVANEVPLGDMLDAYDLCRLFGLEKIQFAVDPAR